MQRYFFHTEGVNSTLDQEGMELADHQLARVEAARLLGEMLRDNAHDFWAQKSLRLIVTDHQGLILFALDLSGIEAPAVRQDRIQSV